MFGITAWRHNYDLRRTVTEKDRKENLKRIRTSMAALTASPKTVFFPFKTGCRMELALSYSTKVTVAVSK